MLTPELPSVLNNREWASVLWAAATCLFVLVVHPKILVDLGGVMRSFAHPKVLIPWAGLISWVLLEISVGSRVGLWSDQLAKETVIWFVFSGLVLFMNWPNASQLFDFLKRRVVPLLAPVVVLGFVLDLFVLPLLVEVALQPVLFVLIAIPVVSGTNVEYARLKQLAETGLGLVGVVLIIGSLSVVALEWASLDKGAILREAILPIWLTLGLVPFIYALALYGDYEMRKVRARLGLSGRT